MNKKESNRMKVLRRRNARKGVNRIFWIAVLVVISLLGFMTFQIYQKYMETLDWEKMDPSVTLASQSLDLLYDKDPESKKSKVEFNKLRDRLLTQDGQLTDEANKSNVNELKRLLGKINNKSSEVDYDKEYAEVALKYSLDVQYNDLFKDKAHSQFKSHVTPLTLAKLNDSTFKDLETLFNMNHNDKFVQDYVEKENKLVDDANVFNELVGVFNEAVIVDKKTISLKEGYKENLGRKFDSTFKNLRYDWSSTEYMSRIVNLLGPLNEEVIKDYDKYQAYLTDMANKDVAYEQWQITQNEWFQAVEAIHNQAIAEKRAREEAARIKKELEEAIKVAIEDISKLKNISDTERKDYLAQIANASTANEVRGVVYTAQARDKFIVDEKERLEKEAEEQKKKEEEEANKPKPKPEEPVSPPKENETEPEKPKPVDSSDPK